MRFQGALVTEQGLSFAIAIVKSHVLHSSDRDAVRAAFAEYFGVPTVLMAQDSRGIPRYYGRRDIVNFLASIHISRIPWMQYQLSA